MSSKFLLKTYIKQGREYKKILQQANFNGKNNYKITTIDEKLKKAELLLKAL